MRDEETEPPLGGAPEHVEDSEPDTSPGRARGEEGRGEPLDDSPEARMMRGGTVTTSNPAPLPPDMERASFDDIDTAAADDARNDVRRREHSAD